ncbi:MAG: polysaccharide lyase family protein [Tepidisphaeraceae bacterium]
MFNRMTTAAGVLMTLGLTALAAAGPTQPDVTLKDNGATVELSNGLISATIVKDGASIRSMRFKGIDMLNDGYYSMDGGKNYRRPGHCIYSVKVNTPDMVDIAMKRVWKDEPQAFDIDCHYVLRRGDTGIYAYALLSHPANYPATSYGEWRYVWKLNNDTLEHIYTDDQRQWQMQSSKDTFEPTPIKEIIKLTSGIRAGQYDCKYDFNCSYYKVGAWGHASDKNKVGAFIVLGSQEFFNDGPTKQDLNAASGINHIHFGMNHYNGSNPKLAAGEAWQKMFGPFLLYCNSGATADACWADAKAKVKTEHDAWPYAWLTNYAPYPSQNQRGAATGTFRVADALQPQVTGANAWIGLCQPPAGGNWQFDSMNYQYWTRVGPDGSFTIPHVRPGDYTLYAFTDGEVGELQQAGVHVDAGQTTRLNTVTWTPVHPGKTIAWQIGTPDRTATEFRHGDDYFHGYVWQKLDKEFPNPIDYTIGKSQPRDLPYAHTRYGDSTQPNVWNIHFNLNQAPAGDATLVLSIASAYRAKVNVAANGKTIATVTPAVQGGNALLREAIHAKYCFENVKIPANALKAGANTISLSFPPTRDVQAHIMYDSISLELP